MKEKKVKMRRMLILFFGFMIYASSVFAGDPPDSINNADRDWCEPPVDLSEDFPKEVKDQSDLGYCWAFATTSLVENYACRKHMGKCESFSTVDAISLYPESLRTIGKPTDPRNNRYEEGGWPDMLLQLIKEEGICSQDLTEYNPSYGGLSIKQSWDSLLEMYDIIKEEKDVAGEINNECSDNFAVFADTWYDLYLNIFSTLVPGTTREEVIDALSQENKKEYLRRLLVSKECISQHQTFDYSIHQDDAGYFQNNRQEENIHTISDQLRRGIPLLVTLECPPQSPICGAGGFSPDGTHALIIKGMRKNPETNKCELLFLNSWGKDWQDEHNGGYIDADSVLEDIFLIDWLE